MIAIPESRTNQHQIVMVHSIGRTRGRVASQDPTNIISATYSAHTIKRRLLSHRRELTIERSFPTASISQERNCRKTPVQSMCKRQSVGEVACPVALREADLDYRFVSLKSSLMKAFWTRFNTPSRSISNAAKQFLTSPGRNLRIALVLMLKI